MRKFNLGQLYKEYDKINKILESVSNSSNTVKENTINFVEDWVNRRIGNVSTKYYKNPIYYNLRFFWNKQSYIRYFAALELMIAHINYKIQEFDTTIKKTGF